MLHGIFFLAPSHTIQTQADLINIPVKRPHMRETTALGAAIAAGFAVGIWESFEELQSINVAGMTTFESKMTTEQSTKMFARWEKAVEMSRGWTQ
jgi:glycerol kinase